jgi:hypothetical protein
MLFCDLIPTECLRSLELTRAVCALVCQLFVAPVTFAGQFVVVPRAFIGEPPVGAVMFGLDTLGCLPITPERHADGY